MWPRAVIGRAGHQIGRGNGDGGDGSIGSSGAKVVVGRFRKNIVRFFEPYGFEPYD